MKIESKKFTVKAKDNYGRVYLDCRTGSIYSMYSESNKIYIKDFILDDWNKIVKLELIRYSPTTHGTRDKHIRINKTEIIQIRENEIEAEVQFNSGKILNRYLPYDIKKYVDNEISEPYNGIMLDLDISGVVPYITFEIEYIVNTPPVISGKDKNLGNIFDEINYEYTVFDEDNDTLSIVEKLNNTVINVRNDVKSGTEFTLNISKEDIYKLPIGQTNRISIEVSDGQEKVYRNLTFIRTNTAPVIQVLSGKELGDIITPFTSKIKVTDEEGDKVDLVYTTNQIVLDKNNDYKRVTIHTDTKNDIKLGTEISYSIPVEIFKRMNIGKYELSIKAIDTVQGENEEIITFSRTEDTIDFETKPVATETMPKQFISLIQIVGNPKHSKIMACNNGLDAKPNWEDITKFALDGSPYTFKNTSKTAAKWAVKIKVNIDGKEVK